MSLQTTPYKGARDFYPEEKRIQNYMFDTVKHTVELYGYEEYDAPILEPLDLYLAKTGEEIVNEQTYAFEDRGGRKVAIRPEMTPTVSRMVAAKRQELAYPLRWYSIPNLWRYERPQRGRLREHWQVNVDLFGIEGISAEFEIISVADAIFKAFGAQRSMYAIRLNSRKLMDYLLSEYLGLDDAEAGAIAKLIDRMHKMERADFVTKAEAIMTPLERENGVVERLLDILSIKTTKELPEIIRALPTVLELEHVLKLLDEAGISNANFDITLMRGFDYYTDLVFEIFDTDQDNNRSMMGGGRYDGLVGLFGVEPIPTIGFGLGDVTLQNFLRSHHLLPNIQTPTQIYVALVGEVFASAQKPITELRDMGLNVAVSAPGKKIGDQFKIAQKKGIHYVLIIGEDEIQNELFTLKNIVSGEEEKHSLERIVSIINDYRINDSY
ncbi:MAG TPA: histidine--tRNA ligase [Candidatus Saccharimonadales bacterium]|nr:histidine--tRNA ligase [Candidatus Saccharimonadales bacterium]